MPKGKKEKVPKRKKSKSDEPGISFRTQDDWPVIPEEIVVNVLCNTCGCTEFTVLRDNSQGYNEEIIHKTRVQCNNCQNVYIVKWVETADI